MKSVLSRLLKQQVKKTAISAAQNDSNSQKKLLIMIITAASSFLLILITLIVVIFGPIMMSKQYIDDITNEVSTFFEKIGNTKLTLKGWCSETDGSCEKQAEQSYYEELNDTYQKYQNKGTKIDVELITATIFYQYNTIGYLYDTDEEGINQNFVKYYCKANKPGWKGEKNCEEYVKDNYEEIYKDNFDKYVKIVSNYNNLSKNNCNNNEKQIYELSQITQIPIETLKEGTAQELCEFYLWNYADLSEVKYDENSMEILYREGMNDIEKLASNMVSGNRLDYTKYRNYLINTYIPKRFKDMYQYKSDKDKEIEKIADEIMMFKSLEEGPVLANQTYGSCKYNMSQNTVDTSNLNVVLLTCDGSRELERVDFETYIKGVVYGEVGNTWPAEVLKAQAVATRSYTLTRNETLCPGRPNDCEYGYNPKKNEIRMRNCEADQVYCDYKKGCQRYSYNGYNSLISGTQNPSLKIYKEALSEPNIEIFENTLNEVQGKVLINENNATYAASYIDVDQNAWNSMYNANNSIDYNEILIKHYWNKTKSNLTIASNCTSYGNMGEFSEWKQFDPRWKDVNIGYDTLHRSGCLVTSISIQFARTGTVNLPEFNPGIFANELTKRGGFSAGGGLLWDPLIVTINQLSNGKFQAVNLDYSLQGTKQNKINTLKQFLDSGNLLVLGVKYEGHWVAVDRIENDKVYIFDPGDSYVNEISQKYDWGGVTKAQIYKATP